MQPVEYRREFDAFYAQNTVSYDGITGPKWDPDTYAPFYAGDVLWDVDENATDVRYSKGKGIAGYDAIITYDSGEGTRNTMLDGLSRRENLIFLLSHLNSTVMMIARGAHELVISGQDPLNGTLLTNTIVGTKMDGASGPIQFNKFSQDRLEYPNIYNVQPGGASDYLFARVEPCQDDSQEFNQNFSETLCIQEPSPSFIFPGDQSAPTDDGNGPCPWNSYFDTNLALTMNYFSPVSIVARNSFGDQPSDFSDYSSWYNDFTISVFKRLPPGSSAKKRRVQSYNSERNSTTMAPALSSSNLEPRPFDYYIATANTHEGSLRIMLRINGTLEDQGDYEIHIFYKGDEIFQSPWVGHVDARK